MEPADLYLKHDKVFVSEDNVIVEADYDSVKVGTTYFVITKTQSFSIYKKAEKFDDDFLKIEKDKNKAEEFLKFSASKSRMIE